MKQHLVRAGDRLAPGVMSRARTRVATSRGRLALRLDTLQEEVGGLREEVATLQTHVGELREEIDETRRDNIRLVELTDIVEHRLAGRMVD